MDNDLLKEIAEYFEQPDTLDKWEFVDAKRAEIAKQLRELRERLNHLRAWPK